MSIHDRSGLMNVLFYFTMIINLDARLVHTYMCYYRSITIVQSDTGKYHELVAPYYYECAARVIIP